MHATKDVIMSLFSVSRSLILAGCVLALGVQVAFAQGNPAKKPEKQSLNHEGILKGVRPPFLNLDIDGKDWVIKVEAPADKIRYHATATANWLKSGMLVQFDQADEKGATKEPIKALTVFAPSQEFRPGVFDEGDGSFLVMGQIKSVRKNRITLVAGRKPTRVELDDDVEIQVKLNHVDFMRMGDTVKVEGAFYQEGQGIAESIEVTAAEQLTGKTKKGRRRRAKSNP